MKTWKPWAWSHSTCPFQVGPQPQADNEGDLPTSLSINTVNNDGEDGVPQPIASSSPPVELRGEDSSPEIVRPEDCEAPSQPPFSRSSQTSLVHLPYRMSPVPSYEIGSSQTSQKGEVSCCFWSIFIQYSKWVLRTQASLAYAQPITN